MSYFSRFSLLVLLFLTIGAAVMGQSSKQLDQFLPAAVQGWNITEPDRHHTAENLHEYINGGAELYISYGVKNVWSRIYGRPGEPDLMVDIFEMGSSQDAFGVFSHARETVQHQFGQGSQYTAGLLMFWKGRYFVSLLASPETNDSRAAVMDLAGRIDASIEGTGPAPEVLNLLPSRGLVPESVKYFTHHAWLNSFYYVADENILNIGRETPAVLARYGEKGSRSVLLIVRYGNQKQTAAAYDNFKKYYLPELDREPVVRIEDGTWTGGVKHPLHLLIVFNAPDRATAQGLLESVRLDHD